MKLYGHTHALGFVLWKFAKYILSFVYTPGSLSLLMK